MREHRVLGQLQHRDRVLSTHGRKVFEEAVEGVAFFEIVEKCLDRDTGAGEHDCAAHHRIGPRNQGLRNRHLRLGLK